MQIFKAFFKIAAKLKGSIIMYVAIFITIGVLITGSASDAAPTFSQSRLKVVVFDEDNSPESRALIDFISKNNDIIEMENDPEKLRDSLYYFEIDYVLTIKEDYGRKLADGSSDSYFTYSVDPKSYNCEYFNLQLEQYVSTMQLYLTVNSDIEAAQAKTIAAVENDTSVTAQNFTDGSADSEISKFIIFMRYLAYILPAIMITVLSRIIIELRSENIRNRTFCSPISPIKYNGQIFAASMIFCIVIWVFTVMLSFILGGSPEITGNILLTILNSFIFMLISAGLAVLISMCFGSNNMAIDMIANIICLGMAFLCGVFVDQSLLGESVLNVARFLPAYWYVCAVENIGQVSGAVFNASLVWKYFGIESLYAVAIFALSMVAARFKKS